MLWHSLPIDHKTECDNTVYKGMYIYPPPVGHTTMKHLQEIKWSHSLPVYHESRFTSCSVKYHHSQTASVGYETDLQQILFYFAHPLSSNHQIYNKQYNDITDLYFIHLFDLNHGHSG